MEKRKHFPSGPEPSLQKKTRKESVTERGHGKKERKAQKKKGMH